MNPDPYSTPGIGNGSSAPISPNNPGPTSTPQNTQPTSQPVIKSSNSQSQTPQTPQPQGLDQTSFMGILNNVENSLKYNNSLMSARQLLVKHMFDSPLTPQELSQLPPDMQKIVQSGDPNEIALQIRVINDQVQGRAGTLDKSISALTTAYSNAQSNAQNAMVEILNYAKATGQPIDKVAKALSPIYGVNLTNQMMDTLKALGAPLLTTTQIPTGTTINIPTGTIASQTNNPLNIKYDPSNNFGASDSGISATDGGTFASFSSPQDGLSAAIQLLQTPFYQGMTVDQAMRTWSNNGYGAEVSNISGSTPMSSLSDSQLQQLVSDMAQRESGTSISQESDIQVQADAIANGTMPPPNPTTSRSSVATRQLFAELARRGFDVGKAYLQFQAALSWTKNMNSAQMIRFQGLATSVVNTIDNVNQLSDQMELSGIPALNLAELTAYIQTQGNSPKGQLASQYLAAVNTLKEEFANLAQGGYAPTEAAWSLANKQINENYGNQQLKASLQEVQRLINFRLNAIYGTTPVSQGNTPTAGSSDTQLPSGVTAGSTITYQGKQYTVDQNGDMTPVQ